MGILVEDEHPAPFFSILHKVFDLLLLFIGIVIVVVSILYLVVLNALGGIFTIVLILGVVMAGISVLALFGSGYFEPKRSDRLICLQLNFIFLLIVAAIFLICALFCFVTPDVVTHLLKKNWQSIMAFIDTLPEKMQKVGDVLTQLMEKTSIIGVIFISLSFLLLADMSLSVLLMGVRVFVETLCRYGSVALSILGGIILGVVIYLYATYPALVKTFSAVAAAAIVLGVLCVLVGLSGIFLSCSCITTKITFPLLLISLFYTGLLVLCLAGIVLVFQLSEPVRDKATSIVSETCTGNNVWKNELEETKLVYSKDECRDFMRDFIAFFCNDSNQIDPCPSSITDDEEAVSYTLHSYFHINNNTLILHNPSQSQNDDEDIVEDPDAQCQCKNLNSTTTIGYLLGRFDFTLDQVIKEFGFIGCVMLSVLGAVIGVLTVAFFFYYFKAKKENKLYNESVERRKNMGLLIEEEDDENYNIRDRGGGFANNAEQIQMQEQAELMAQQQLLERYAERKEQQRNLQAALKQSAQEQKEKKKAAAAQEQQELERAINASMANDWSMGGYDYGNFASQYPSY